MAVVDLEKTGSEPDLLDDSGPYEEILDDYLEKKIERAPIGRLPSYISLDSTINLQECDLAENLVEKVDDEPVESEKMEEQGTNNKIDERLI